MRHIIYHSITLILLLLTTIAAADSNPDFISAKSVIDDWYAAILDKQVDKASAHMAPTFVSVRRDGIVRNKDAEIQLIKNSDMPVYHLTDFNYTASGNVITVIFNSQTIEKKNAKAVASNGIQSRMIVLQKQNDKWMIVSYANLD